MLLASSALLCLMGIFGFQKPSISVFAAPVAENPDKGLSYKQLRKSDNKLCKGKFEIVDRTGQARGCTHGPDPTPEGRNVSYQPPPRLQKSLQSPGTAQASAPVLCAGDGVSGRRFEVIYARASDKPDRYSQYVESFRQYMVDANEIVRQSGIQTGEARHLRYVTETVGSGCQVKIHNVVLPSNGDDDIYETINSLDGLGYDNPDRKYMVLMDANVYCGIAEIWEHDIPSPENFNNRNGGGAMYGRVDTGCWDSSITIAHEMIHNLGGVQNTAPNATPYGHCTDEYDVMCYKDSAETVLQYTCPISEELRLDCNKNDYFNTNPAINSYLDSHWNVADNSFLIRGEIPDNNAPNVAFTTLSEGSYVRLNVNPATTISDSEEIIRTQLFVDGNLTDQDLVFPFTGLNFRTGDFSDGTHTLRLVAVDASGNVGTTPTISVIVDNTVPTAPSDVRTTTVTPNQVNLAWDASTDNIGVSDYIVTRNSVVIDTVTTPSFSDNSVTALNNYSYQIRARDRAGNTMSSTILEVSVPSASDTVAPTVTLTSPQNGNLVWADKVNGTVTIQATANDNEAVATVELFVNGMLQGNLTGTSPGQYSMEWFSLNLSPGVYDLAVRATDSNGNSQLSTSVALTLAVSVHRLYRAENNKHFYTGSASERDTTAQGSYRYEDTSFYASPVDSTTITVPVYRLYSPITQGHFYTTNVGERDFAVTLGYRYERIEFYSAPDTGGGEFIPVFRLYNDTTKSHLFTPSVGERDFAVTLGYRYEGVAFYAKEAPPSNIVPIYRLYNTRNYDHLFTANSAERNATLGSEYVDEGIGFFARSSADYGHVPVYRLYSLATGDHLYTANSAERDFAQTIGYRYEGVAFYTNLSGGYGQTNIYRLYNPSTHKHLYTSNFNEKVFAEGFGYRYEGVGFYAIN